MLTLALEMENEKRRTDVSACVNNPVFAMNVVVFPLKNGQLNMNERLHFAAFVITDRNN